MLFLVFFYVLAAVLVFQGLHLLGERTQPLGTLPEEVGLAKIPSGVWGAYLTAYGASMVGCGLLSHAFASVTPALVPLRALGALSLLAFGAWVVFLGRRVEYLGSAADADHGHH